TRRGRGLAEDDGGRMPGARIRQLALARVVSGDHDRGEGAGELAIEHASGRPQRLARGEAGLEIGPYGEAQQRRVRQRLAPVPGDVADDHGDLAILEREHVVE